MIIYAYHNAIPSSQQTFIWNRLWWYMISIGWVEATTSIELCGLNFRFWWKHSASGQNGNKWCLGFNPFIPKSGSNRTCIWGHKCEKLLFSHSNEKLRYGSHQSILLSVVGQSSHFNYYIRIQEKMAIKLDSSDLTLSYRKVVQIELVSEVFMRKMFVFAFKWKAKTWVTSINFAECCGSNYPLWW